MQIMFEQCVLVTVKIFWFQSFTTIQRLLSHFPLKFHLKYVISVKEFVSPLSVDEF